MRGGDVAERSLIFERSLMNFSIRVFCPRMGSVPGDRKWGLNLAVAVFLVGIVEEVVVVGWALAADCEILSPGIDSDLTIFGGFVRGLAF